MQKTLFPIGELRKDEVRKRAHSAGLPVFDKPDSTGICFIGERPFGKFLGAYLKQAPGPIEDSDGHVIGEHRGLALYTLGQRSGLRIGGRAGAAAAPWYAAAKDRQRNTLIAVQDQDHPLLLSDGFDMEGVRWLSGRAPAADRFTCAVKTRYRQKDVGCDVRITSDGARVTLETAARAVTPGQYAVLYRGDMCLGGGVIARRYNSVSVTASTIESQHA